MSYPFLHPDHRTSHTFDLRAKRCTTLLSNELHSVLCVKTHLHVHRSDVSGQSGYNVRTARSTGYEPNVALDESGTTFRSIADGDDEDLLGIQSFHLGQAPTFFSPEDHVLQMARGDLGAVYRASSPHAVCGEVAIIRTEFLSIRNTCCLT